MPEESTSSSPELPSGMLTVMFTDVEASTTMWERTPDAMRVAMERHDAILSETIRDGNGITFKHTGDGMGAVFTSPDRAASAAVAIQRRLQAEPWPDGIDRLKVRIGMHMGDIEPSNGDYFGPTVNRAARVMDVANGDQIALSGVVGRFVRSVHTRRMGAHQLKGIGTEMIELVEEPDLVHDERALRARVSRSVKPLPAPAHRLIGREADAERVLALLDESQAVTIVGPGGVGKTHFAIDVARSAEHRFADGAVLCELAPVGDESAVFDAIAEAMGARIQPEMSMLESIQNFLEDREQLIIVDNCEHVVDAIADFAEMVAPFRDVTLLMTSRERIGLRSEQVVGLEPLDPATNGVELFLERARERDLEFEPSAADMAAISTICARLDGIPLGIELAAAWVRVLSPEHLLDRLSDRFAVLDRSRGRRGHRQTLRETVQWSYDQLDDDLRRVFDRLSVFSGGFSLDAAVEVCQDESIDAADILDLLMSLVDKSMITSERGTGQIRFAMLETLRQFGAEQLEASDTGAEFRARHAAVFIEIAHHAADGLFSSKEAEVWDLLDREWANIRSTFTTLLETGDVNRATDLVLDLGHFAVLSLRTEAFTWAVELSQLDDFESHVDATSILGLVALHKYFTIDPSGLDDARRGLELNPTDPHGFCNSALAAEALNNVHIAADSEERTTAWLANLTDESPLGSRVWGLGMRVFHLCTNAPSPDAAVHHEEMVRIANGTESASAMALTRWAGGMVASFEGIDSALAEWRRGVDSARSINDVHLLVHLIVGLELHFTASRGDLDTVLERCLATLEQAHEQHYLAGTSHLFGVTAIIMTRVDRAEIGAELIGSMEAHGHIPRGNATHAVTKALGDGAAAARQRGRSLSTNAAAALATDALREAIAERSSQAIGEPS